MTRLENQDQPSARFGVIATLIGALGPCLTDAVRRDETAPIHFVAHRLRQAVGATMHDGAMAFHLAEVILASTLPDALQPHSAGSGHLMNELVDALTYVSSTANRETIEERRVFCLGRRYYQPFPFPPFHSSACIHLYHLPNELAPPSLGLAHSCCSSLGLEMCSGLIQSGATVHRTSEQ